MQDLWWSSTSQLESIVIIIIQSDFAASLQKLCNCAWWIAGKECPQAGLCPMGDTLIEKVFIDVVLPHIQSAVKYCMRFIFDAVLAIADYAGWTELLAALVISHLELSELSHQYDQLHSLKALMAQNAAMNAMVKCSCLCFT